MPGQIPAASEAVQPDYHSRKRAAIAKIKELVERKSLSSLEEIRSAGHWNPNMTPFLSIVFPTPILECH
jgi:hypothetical protein